MPNYLNNATIILDSASRFKVDEVAETSIGEVKSAVLGFIDFGVTTIKEVIFFVN